MTTALVSMCRDEADIAEAFIRHAASQVDFMVVADNNSVDGTRDILERLAKELPTLTVVDDPEVGYYQSRKMSELGEQAREMGADWIVPADFDEIWVSPHGRLGDILEQHTPDYGLVTAELYDYVATGIDGCEADPTRRLRWRRPYPLPLHKVSARAVPGLVIAMGNHWAHHPIPARFTESPALVVRHLPYRSADQFIRKARNGSEAYRATTGLDESVGAHWRQWGHFSDEQLADVFFTYYWRDDPRQPLMLDGEEQPSLVYDPVPWV